MVEGICVEHCPLTKIPVAGECKTDPVALKFLDVELGRFRLVSISNGSVIVNVVLVPADGVLGTNEIQSRSPEGLLSMLRALQADEMSAVYENKFFQNVDRMYAPPHVNVRECADSEYRTICPFQFTDTAPSVAMMLFLVGTVI